MALIEADELGRREEADHGVRKRPRVGSATQVMLAKKHVFVTI
jgi:hypothetical protein